MANRLHRPASCEARADRPDDLGGVMGGTSPPYGHHDRPFGSPTRPPRHVPGDERTPPQQGFLSMERTGIEPVTSGLRNVPGGSL
jgi:hypothetical protein